MVPWQRFEELLGGGCSTRWRCVVDGMDLDRCQVDGLSLEDVTLEETIGVAGTRFRGLKVTPGRRGGLRGGRPAAQGPRRAHGCGANPGQPLLADLWARPFGAGIARPGQQGEDAADLVHHVNARLQVNMASWIGRAAALPGWVP